MINVTLIGGGISGLSAATILSEIPNIKISIYEKEKQIGGQKQHLNIMVLVILNIHSKKLIYL